MSDIEKREAENLFDEPEFHEPAKKTEEKKEFSMHLWVKKQIVNFLIPVAISVFLTTGIIKLYRALQSNKVFNQSEVDKELKQYGDSIITAYINQRIEEIEMQKKTFIDSIIILNVELTSELSGKNGSEPGYGSNARAIEKHIVDIQGKIKQANEDIQRYNEQMPKSKP